MGLDGLEAPAWLCVGGRLASLRRIKLLYGSEGALLVRPEQELPLGATALYIC